MQDRQPHAQSMLSNPASYKPAYFQKLHSHISTVQSLSLEVPQRQGMLAWVEHYPAFGCKIASVQAAQSTSGTNRACLYDTGGSSITFSPPGEQEQYFPHSEIISAFMAPTATVSGDRFGPSNLVCFCFYSVVTGICHTARQRRDL